MANQHHPVGDRNAISLTIPLPAATDAAPFSRALCYVEDNFTRKISLTSTAAHCGISPSSVSQLFQRHLGTSFHQYVTHLRLAAAEELIRSGIPLEQIHAMVGYQDHSTFYRAFRKKFGHSPRQYRQQLESASFLP